MAGKCAQWGRRLAWSRIPALLLILFMFIGLSKFLLFCVSCCWLVWFSIFIILIHFLVVVVYKHREC